jgi:hypothetical protein
MKGPRWETYFRSRKSEEKPDRNPQGSANGLWHQPGGFIDASCDEAHGLAIITIVLS